MDVKFERDSLSTARYVTLPAYAYHGDAKLDVLSWSLEGFYAKKTDHPHCPNAISDEFTFEFVLPFENHNAGFHVKAHFMEDKDGKLYFKFTNLSSANRKLMRDYFESSLRAVEPQVDADYNLVQPMSQAEQKTTNTKLLARLLFYGTALFMLSTISWYIYREFSYVYSLRGTVMGDLVQVKAPDVNYIDEVYVKDGDKVKAGQPLYKLRTDLYEAQLKTMKSQREALVKELEAAEASVENEKKRNDLYVQMAEKRLQTLYEQRKHLVAQARSAESVYETTARLARTGAAAKQEVILHGGSHEGLLSQVKVCDHEIKLAKTAIEEAKQNRFITSGIGFTTGSTGYGVAGPGAMGSGSTVNTGEIKGDLVVKLQEVALKKTQIATLDVQIATTETLIKRSSVLAWVDGTVNHLARRKGDYVTTNDYIMSIQCGGNSRYVAARFTTDDAKYIQYDQMCKIISTPRGKVWMGKVIAIGHTGLNDRGLLSPDDETALDELVVKFELPEDADLRGGESVWIKVRRGWSLESFLEKLR